MIIAHVCSRTWSTRPTESFLKSFLHSFFGGVPNSANCDITGTQMWMCSYRKETWLMFSIGLSFWSPLKWQYSLCFISVHCWSAGDIISFLLSSQYRWISGARSICLQNGRQKVSVKLLSHSTETWWWPFLNVTSSSWINNVYLNLLSLILTVLKLLTEFCCSFLMCTHIYS